MFVADHGCGVVVRVPSRVCVGCRVIAVCRDACGVECVLCA